MKTVSRLLFLFFAFTISAGSIAQTIGVKAGLNMSNMLMKDDEGISSDEYKMNPGFHIGPTAEFYLNDMFSFEAALLVSTKGFKAKESGDSFEYKGKLNLYCLDIPLMFKTRFDAGSIKIYGALGPYVGMGLTGKTKYEISYGGETESNSESIKWGSDSENDDFKRLDFGAVAEAGVEISSIRLGVSYGYGLANISSYTEGGTRVSNRVLSVSAGYRFGAK